jgi:hypothetical protein
MARGPVHEAFATPTTEPRPTQPVAKKPPAPLDEMAPDEKPEGDVVWISGYWAWDDDRSDFLWVSGCWRQRPRGKEWIGGYWREQGEQWQWVPGFWTDAVVQAASAKEITYYPEPPPPPVTAPPGAAPSPESFWVPGNWVWNGERYVWRAGYWARVQPGYVWVPGHYRWTPYGYVYVAGYWDYAVAQRGILYAPVVVDAAVVGPRFVYTPVYAVPDAVVMDAFFVRPAYCHYYFGDYYGPRYREIGFESVVVYSRRSYDPIIVYQRYEYRNDPRWLDVQVNLVVARDAGRAPLPPRTLVQQNTIIQQTIINNNTTVINNNVTNNTVVNNKAVIAPAARVAAAQGVKTVPLDATARAQVQQQAQTAQQAAVAQRRQAETPPAPGARPMAPRVAALQVPAAARTAVGSPGAGSRPGRAAPGVPTAAKTAATPHPGVPATPHNPNAPPATSGLRAPPGGVVMPGQAARTGPGGSVVPGQTKGPLPGVPSRPPQRQPPPPPGKGPDPKKGSDTKKGSDSKEKQRSDR